MKIIILLLAWIQVAVSATYYVDVSTDPSGDGSQGDPWDAFSDATAAVVDGDIVRVQAGTYAESPTESTDGTLGNYITYVADGAVTITGLVTLSGDYIRWIGFTMDRNLGGNECIFINNATGVEVWNCTLREFLRNGIMMDSGGGSAESHRCIIIGNTVIGTFGTAGSTGESRHIAIRGDSNLVSHNTLHTMNVDGIYWFGDRNRFYNNYSFGSNPDSAAHCDFFQTGTDAGGNTFTTIEANFYVDSDTPGEDHHFSNMSNGGADFTNLLLRGNVAHQIGTATHSIFQNWDGIFIYNESYLEAWKETSSPLDYCIAIFNGPDNIFLYNSIFRDAWAAATSNIDVYLLQPATTEGSDYNLAFDSDDAVTFGGDHGAGANNIDDVDPLMVNYASDNFLLGESSPARNAGTALTLVNETNGSGTTLTLDNAGYFRGDDSDLDAYSGALVVGDSITIGTDAVTITSISGNDITFTPSITWADNDPVYWGGDTTPDIGAFPGTHDPLTAATYFAGAVTPDGDTRFVVQFRAGIPIAVDNSAPFSFSHETGDVYRAYAQYASKTPYVQATAAPGSGELIAPNANLGNLIIGTL